MWCTKFRNAGWLVILFCGFCGGQFLSNPATATAGEIVFETLDAGATGIAPIFQAWYDAEMELQGGPGKSHGWWPWGLRAFDYDGDGDLDLIASHHGTPRSIIIKSLFKETGKMQFADAMPELGLSNRDLPGADDRPWIWDIDGDGWLDFVGLSDETKPPAGFNKQGKTFEMIQTPLLGSLSHPKEVADIDGDGYPDVDGGSKGQWFYLPAERRFRHDPTPRFPKNEEVPAEVLASIEAQKGDKPVRFFGLSYWTHTHLGDAAGYAPHPIDLNNDGKPDLVLHGSGGYGAPYLGRYLVRDDSGKLVDRTGELGLPIDGAPIFCGDVTGNGRTDVLIAGTKTGGVYLQGADGRFNVVEGPATDFLRRIGPYLLRVWQVDFDNDGLADLVMSNPRMGREAVFANQGDGKFESVLSVGGWDSNPVVIADFDGDGLMDLAIGGDFNKGDKRGITIYMNRSKNTGNYTKIQPRMASPNPNAIGAVVEVFPAGKLGDSQAQPLWAAKANIDGTPIHVGLGKAATFDLRVTFPGGKTVESRGAKAGSTLVVDLPSNSVRVAAKP